MIKRMKSFFQNSKTKIVNCFVTTSIFLSAVFMPQLQANNAKKTIPDSKVAGADDLVYNLVGIICAIFRYIGILLLVWSVGMLVLAFKNEDADSKSRAMMLLVVSCVLIAIKSLVEIVLVNI